jgi:hypothetical protein
MAMDADLMAIRWRLIAIDHGKLRHTRMPLSTNTTGSSAID